MLVRVAVWLLVCALVFWGVTVLLSLYTRPLARSAASIRSSAAGLHDLASPQLPRADKRDHDAPAHAERER